MESSNNQFEKGTLVLILGIACILLTLVSCCIIYAMLPSIICGILALVYSKKELNAATALGHDPKTYLNYQNLSIGRILAIIGLVITVLLLLLVIVVVIAVGPELLMELASDPEALQEYLESLQQ